MSLGDGDIFEQMAAYGSFPQNCCHEGMEITNYSFIRSENDFSRYSRYIPDILK